MPAPNASFPNRKLSVFSPENKVGVFLAKHVYFWPKVGLFFSIAPRYSPTVSTNGGANLFFSLMTLHIFNPSHDEALAAHTAHYCPTRPARRLAHALAELPRLWAAADDVCLRLPESGGTEGAEVPDWAAVERIEPWGWDRHLVGLLRRLGAPERLLPSDERLCLLRRMSSRETGVRWAEGLHTDDLPGVVQPRAVFCTSTAAVEAAAAAMDGRAMVKQPWSCSGRGVWAFADDEACRRRIDKTIRQQGGVEVQARCEGLLDAALEFYIDAAGSVHFEGVSLFTTAPGGAYGGNLAAHPAQLRRTLLDRAATVGSPLAEEAFDTLIARMAMRIEEVYGAGCADASARYVGPLGVDVLVAREGWLPYVEINLRRTMGHVALAAGRNFSADAPPRMLRLGAHGWDFAD